ncbi:unnamed protein product [Parnassius apollo]|uniref:(apollo) hypothetical protein n=1 Tax=Parnassius apollo TaxID=110799 RepID=A0A8S3WNU2_PARAO|nr:unnamed protein product [Parnassius apollo]
MAASTVTRTSVIENPVCDNRFRKKYELRRRLCGESFNNNTKDSCVYDETRPMEPKFLAPLREWEKKMGFVTAIRWTNTISIIFYHIVTVVFGIYYLTLGLIPKWQTFVFGYVMGQIAGFGVTAGVHRYWTHRSYKATLPLRIILIICYSVAGQNNIYNWVRDHRIHHKFSETSADPHDARRGFFFSHVGWLMMKKHPDVIREGRKTDMSDIANDRLIQFHTKYIMPAENWGVSVVAMGEGWHNYHHTFPWDYKASELAYVNNITTTILNLYAKIGWAYDMKQASPSLIKSVIENRGTITHHH